MSGWKRGSNNYNAKLSLVQVAQIRLAHARGARRKDLALDYRVAETTIYRIVKEITWRKSVK